MSDDTEKLTAEDIGALKEFAGMYRLGKRTAIKAIVTLIVGAIGSLICYGLVHWVRSFGVVLVAALLLGTTGCLAPTRNTTTVYRDDGSVERVIESSESVVKTITDSTRNKTCVTWDNGWLGGIAFVPPGSDAENPAGALKLLAGKNDRGAVTFSDKHDAKNLPQVIEAARAGEISLGAGGVTNKTNNKADESAAK